MPKHEETRYLPYTPEQVYAVVADVSSYPRFLPWCQACRITNRFEGGLEADMVIRFKMFKERFKSRVELEPYEAITVSYVDGPFKYLTNQWGFTPAGDHGCDVRFFVEFEFRSRILQSLIGLLFDEAVRRMTGAFEQRAHDLYVDVRKTS